MGVESDWVTNSSQFYLPFGLAVNTLHTEGLDFCLHARHQSNMGHFVQPRVSDGVHDQASKGDKFELVAKEIFGCSYTSTNLSLIPVFRMRCLPEMGMIFGFRGTKASTYLHD